MPPLPLEGIRVIDLSRLMAGPTVTMLLGDMGAEIIKVESIQRIDGWRGGRIPQGVDKAYELSPLFNAIARNKLGITLNLTERKGAEVLKRLVKIGDVLVENYTPRVMKNFGLGYPVLQELNPTLVMISMPGYGSTGPRKDYTAFAYPIEEMAGICQLTGFPDGPPLQMGHGGGDGLAGMVGSFAVVAALHYRQRTGKGQYIDLAQCEAVTSLIGETIVDYSLNRRVHKRRGNRHPFMAPHGCYRCQGEDRWVTISVATEEEWMSFCAVLGDPPWAREARFADALSRWQNQDELDKLIEEWTLQRDHIEVMHTLQKAGVAAGAVLDAAELLHDPHLNQRGFYEVVHRERVGAHPYPGLPIRFSKTPGKIRRPSPLLGEYNDYVFRELLGMSSEEVENLAQEKIIGTEVLTPRALSGRG